VHSYVDKVSMLVCALSLSPCSSNEANGQSFSNGDMGLRPNERERENVRIFRLDGFQFHFHSSIREFVRHIIDSLTLCGLFGGGG